MSKRVYALYRVLSTEEMEMESILLQQIACRRFVAEQGWELVKELTEPGGAAIPEEDRLHEIRCDAVDGKFDVLLVYEYQRIGQVPFALLWLLDNGIEAVSITEEPVAAYAFRQELRHMLRYWQVFPEHTK